MAASWEAALTQVLQSRQWCVTCITPPSRGTAYPDLGPWACAAALGPFFPRQAQPPAGLFFHANNNAMAKQKQPPGEPMKLGNMRHLGAQRLVASCLNDGFSGASLRFICARTEL